MNLEKNGDKFGREFLGGPKALEKQDRKNCGKTSSSKFAEKFAGNFPKLRHAKINNSSRVRSAEPRDQQLRWLTRETLGFHNIARFTFLVRGGPREMTLRLSGDRLGDVLLSLGPWQRHLFGLLHDYAGPSRHKTWCKPTSGKYMRCLSSRWPRSL